MNKVFFFILCLFLFIGCSKQEEVGTQETQETQATSQEAQGGQASQANVAPEPAKEKTDEAEQEVAKMRNPFLTEEEENAQKQTGTTIPIAYLTLSAVLYSPNASRAIVNGQILTVGDSIDNKEVVRIDPESVILKDAQGQYILRLKNVSGE